MEALINELKVKIIEALNLDMQPDEIDATAPLFGDGLGLDSIDSLELIVMLEDYGIRLEKEDEMYEAFASVQSMAQYVEANRK